MMMVKAMLLFISAALASPAPDVSTQSLEPWTRRG
jgi:hypothetical protein